MSKLTKFLLAILFSFYFALSLVSAEEKKGAFGV
jgi:hypothetical protein